ncbi:DUF2332 domain-containing protein [uncultured Cohaesibacter sp.]|uniref:DUF2332 domain-containing protein n=1 Tax=uncultured Cohaesibacter sp. TaxID=1002546 RepID=UPI0029C87838|nr:DUF2332 domain-containing protein [uncultured Cohaesibacter sp.]
MNEKTIERYRRFAETEAAGRSALYEELALHVSMSDPLIGFLDRLPEPRRQPNLFFAATRFVAGLPTNAEDFEDLVAASGDRIAEVMCERTTQTNEPGRCATLMPSLARIDGPISLIEVGASAGLCLLPDCYGYDWGRHKLAPPSVENVDAPVFPCRASANAPLPIEHPEIVWRAGLDLNPLDVDSEEDMSWLKTLVWPEDVERLHRLTQSIEVARRGKPEVVKGDLRTDLMALIDRAPRDSTVVVFHTAVLSYLPVEADRRQFASKLLDRKDIIWLCNESPRVLSQRLTGAGEPPHGGLFLLSRNGAPVAWTGPHGQSIDWIVCG